MNNKQTTESLPLKDMEKYILEWLVEPKVEIAEVVGHGDEEAYTIYQREEPIYLHIFKKGEYSEDAIVTTAGIYNDELRGMVEQCIRLDRQIESSKTQTPAQKGE